MFQEIITKRASARTVEMLDFAEQSLSFGQYNEFMLTDVNYCFVRLLPLLHFETRVTKIETTYFVPWTVSKIDAGNSVPIRT